MLFIDDGGVLQEDIEGIPYRYSSTISPPDSQRVELLSLNFGGRNEILQKKSK